MCQVKKRRSLLWVLALLICVVSAQGEACTVEEKTRLAEMLNAPSDHIFIDVRSEKEFNLMHIAGFRNMPFDETDWEAFETDGNTVVLICQSGIRAAEIQKLLLENGHANVLCCTFGVEEYLDSVDESSREGYAVCIPCRLRQALEKEKETNEQ